MTQAGHAFETGRYTRAQEPQIVARGLTRDRATDTVLGLSVDLLESAGFLDAALWQERVRRLGACEHPYLPRIRAQAPGILVVDALDGSVPAPGANAVAVVEKLLPTLQALAGLHAHGLVHGALTADSLRVSADGAYVLADAVSACLCAPAEAAGEGQRRDLLGVVDLIATLSRRAASTSAPLADRVRRLPTWLRLPLEDALAGRLDSVAALRAALAAALPTRGPVLWPAWSAPVAIGVGALLVTTLVWAALDVGRPVSDAGAAVFATSTPVPPPRATAHAVQVSGRIFWGQTAQPGLTVVAESVGDGGTAAATTDANGRYALSALALSALTFRLQDSGFAWAAPPAPCVGVNAWGAPRFTLDPPSFVAALQRLPQWTAVTTRTLAADFLVVRTDLIVQDVQTLDDQTLEVSWIPYHDAPADAAYRAIVHSAAGELDAAPFSVQGVGWGTVRLDLGSARDPAEWGFDPPRLWGRLPQLHSDEAVTITVQVIEPYVDAGVTYALPIAQGSRAITGP